MSKYLITGGAGFIGSHLAESLVGRGHSVRILDNFSTGRKDNLSAVFGRVEILEGDIRDRNAVRTAVAGMDFVLHQAALVSVTQSVENPEETLAVNVGGTLNVMQAAREARIRKVVLASSCAVYGAGPIPAREEQATMPLSPYAASKLAGESFALSYYSSYQLPCVCLRYFNVFGPRQDFHSPYSGVIAIFIARAVAGMPVTIYGDGRQTRDFIYVGDVVRANILACESDRADGRVLNIGSGRGRSILDLRSELEALCGVRLKLELSAPRTGDIRHSRCAPKRARALLGFSPKTDFRAGLDATLRWQRDGSGAKAP
ncbi:MAG: NAD-dependent epimerase/dehydratase family protein [Anaerolineales bacterium]